MEEDSRALDQSRRPLLSVDTIVLIGMSAASLWINSTISSLVVTLLIVFLVLAVLAPRCRMKWRRQGRATIFVLRSPFDCHVRHSRRGCYPGGIRDTDTSPFPFGIFDGLFGLPLLVLLVIRQRRQNTLQQVWIACALLSLVVEYFSRFFNDNYVTFALQLAVIGAFIIPARWHNPPMPTYDPPSSVALADGA